MTPFMCQYACTLANAEHLRPWPCLPPPHTAFAATPPPPGQPRLPLCAAHGHTSQGRATPRHWDRRQMGPRPNCQSLSRVDRHSQDEEREKNWVLLPIQEIRDPMLLILGVQTAFLTTHVQRGSFEVKKGGGVTSWWVRSTTQRPPR